MKCFGKISVSLVALVLSAVTASACILTIRVACPNDTTRSGIRVCVAGVDCALTDDIGVATIQVPQFDTYTVCVDASTLPAGATLSPLCQKVKVASDAPPLIEFDLGGSFCSVAPPPGPCWLTGGGTIGTGKQPTYSYGGVVYPGCSPHAADGGSEEARLP